MNSTVARAGEATSDHVPTEQMEMVRKTRYYLLQLEEVTARAHRLGAMGPVPIETIHVFYKRF
jgi:hypothetical protein